MYQVKKSFCFFFADKYFLDTEIFFLSCDGPMGNEDRRCILGLKHLNMLLVPTF